MRKNKLFLEIGTVDAHEGDKKDSVADFVSKDTAKSNAGKK